MAEPYLENLTKTVQGLGLSISDEVSLDCRHFFSGAALYANGQICASLTPAGFGLKLPAEVRARLIEKGEGEELRYFEGAPVKKEYVALLQGTLADRAQLRDLLATSIRYVLERTGDS